MRNRGYEKYYGISEPEGWDIGECILNVVLVIILGCLGYMVANFVEGIL